MDGAIEVILDKLPTLLAHLDVERIRTYIATLEAELNTQTEAAHKLGIQVLDLQQENTRLQAEVDETAEEYRKQIIENYGKYRKEVGRLTRERDEAMRALQLAAPTAVQHLNDMTWEDWLAQAREQLAKEDGDDN